MSDLQAYQLIQQVRQCLRLAGSVDFDAGMDNPLREELPVLVRQFGAPFVELLSTHIRQGKVAPMWLPKSCTILATLITLLPLPAGLRP